MKRFKTISFSRQLLDNFYRFPKWLDYLKVSATTKLTYMYIKDRYSLSEQNGWIDNDNIVYCYFTRESLALKMGVTTRTIIKSIKELEEIGLLKCVKQSQKPSRMYLYEATEEFVKVLYQEYKASEISDETDNIIDNKEELEKIKVKAPKVEEPEQKDLEEAKNNDEQNKGQNENIDKEYIENFDKKSEKKFFEKETNISEKKLSTTEKVEKKVIHNKGGERVKVKKLHHAKCKNFTSCSENISLLKVQKFHLNNNYISKTNISNNNILPSIKDLNNKELTKNEKRTEGWKDLKNDLIKKLEKELVDYEFDLYKKLVPYIDMLNSFFYSGIKIKKTKLTNSEILEIFKELEATDLIELDKRISKSKDQIFDFKKYVFVTLRDIITNKKIKKSIIHLDNHDDRKKDIQGNPNKQEVIDATKRLMRKRREMLRS